MHSPSQDSGNAVVNFLDLLSGGAVRNFSVMAMGVYPYITASIIIQLLTPIIPQLEEMASEGESGRNKINKITYYITVPLAFLQGIGQIRLIGFSLPGGLETLMPYFGFEAGQILPTMTTLVAMVGGTMFAIWIGELITEDGIGQGISLIIFGGIVSRMIPNIAGLFAIPDTGREDIYHSLVYHPYHIDSVGHRRYPRRSAKIAGSIRPSRAWAQSLSRTEHLHPA